MADGRHELPRRRHGLDPGHGLGGGGRRRLRRRRPLGHPVPGRQRQRRGLAHGRHHGARGPDRDSHVAGWRVAAVGDYDGDGRSDILWRQDPLAGRSVTEAQVWTMHGLDVVAAQRLAYIDNGWHMV
uniref:hypothetical protein n=1 Tax=Dankookia rubra TaxID=1442381 RepID=UPI0034DDF4A1